MSGDDKNVCDDTGDDADPSQDQFVSDEKLEGTGRRPEFLALWHLEPLKVIESLDDYISAAWRKIAKEGKPAVRVAIIDTMPAFTHPNLECSIDFDAALDFTRNYVDGEKLDTCKPPHQGFGAHGTAVAGLIGASPRSDIKLRKPPFITGTKDSMGVKDPEIDLPYIGVNPFATLIPIVVSAAPEPAMLRAALAHAGGAKIAADVVVIADSWDRGGTPYPDGITYAQTTEAAGFPDAYGSSVRKDFPHGPPRRPATDPWDEVSYTLRLLCTRTFVFCAAGNEPRERLVYPASLSAPHSGPWAVGACDEKGKDMTYTPPSAALRAQDPRPRLITTLSSQHPRLDEEVQKLDPWAKRDKELDFPKWFFDPEFQPRDIVASDVPGPYGYNPSPYYYVPHENEHKHLEIASLFCRFSGTSAATALAAGLVSLALAWHRAEGNDPPGAGDPPYPGPCDPTAAELFTLTEACELVGRGHPSRATEAGGGDQA